MTVMNENLERLEAAIGEACRKAGRGRGEVELMAVTKTYPAATVAEAAALGLRLFGGGAGTAAQASRETDWRSPYRTSAIEQGGAGGGNL